MPCFRWKLSDLPPRLREQAERQLIAGSGSPRKQPVKGPRPAPQAVGARTGHRMSHTEERFRDRFAPSMGWGVLMYEPCSLWVSGGFRYTPDFLIIMPDGRLAFVETKGSFRLQSHSRARIAFADASTRNPGFLFVWAKESRKHDGFSVEFWERGKFLKHPKHDQNGEKNLKLFSRGDCAKTV